VLKRWQTAGGGHGSLQMADDHELGAGEQLAQSEYRNARVLDGPGLAAGPEVGGLKVAIPGGRPEPSRATPLSGPSTAAQRSVADTMSASRRLAGRAHRFGASPRKLANRRAAARSPRTKTGWSTRAIGKAASVGMLGGSADRLTAGWLEPVPGLKNQHPLPSKERGRTGRLRALGAG